MKRGARSIDQEMIDELQKMRDSGMTIQEIEAKSGISHASISKYTTDNLGATKKGNGRRLTDDQINEMRGYSFNGMSTAAIARKMDLAYQTVKYHTQPTKMTTPRASHHSKETFLEPQLEPSVIDNLQNQIDELKKQIAILMSKAGLVDSDNPRVAEISKLTDPSDQNIMRFNTETIKELNRSLQRIVSQNQAILERLRDQKIPDPIIEQINDDRSLAKKIEAINQHICQSKSNKGLQHEMTMHRLRAGRREINVSMIGNGLVVSQYSDLLSFINNPELCLEEVKQQ